MTPPDVKLPEDDIIPANNEIDWQDVLNLPRDLIDEVYRVSKLLWGIQDENILLRLRRLAGSFKRSKK